jgi:hypothetical protein
MLTLAWLLLILFGIMNIIFIIKLSKRKDLNKKELITWVIAIVLFKWMIRIIDKIS